MNLPHLSTLSLAKLAIVYSGATWGLFWFPLRWLEQSGLEGPWIAVFFYTAQLVLLLPFAIWRFKWQMEGGAGLLITGFFAGSALGLYSLSIVYTDVIRAILLFYLTPLWSSLLARIIFREPITLLRWATIALALCGLVVILGIENGIPLPRNLGDWFGLLSGMMWAAAAVRLRMDPGNHPFELTVGFVSWATLACVCMAILLGSSFTMPETAKLTAALYWLFPFIAFIALPGMVAAMWGPKHVDPGLVGILFMTEIIVGTITAAIWAGEPFGLRELIGVIMIMAASLLESLWDILRRPKRNTAGKTL